MGAQRVVFFDLETGGTQARPVIMSHQQWGALERYDRGPKPAWPVGFWTGTVGPEHTAGRCEWLYCPGNPIIQIAAIACDADSLDELEEFEVKMLFRPDLATEEALEKNSYDVDAWKSEAVHYPDGIQAFCRFLDRHKTVEMASERTGNPYKVAQLAGHNASSFDLEFMLRSCEDPIWQRYALPGDAGRTAPPRGLFFPGSFQVLDTLHAARWRWLSGYLGADDRPKNLKLETLAEFIGYELTGAHDALADVRATVALARYLRAEG